MIAALFVEKDGPYFGMAEVDPWDEERDARKYCGGKPVVAHPPCERWGRYWHGGPSVRVRKKLGDDGGCFKSALVSVRQFGGVLEHPEASHAFKKFKLPIPKWHGGWSEPDRFGGRSCCVAQGHYGHRARKMTWLYAVGTDYPELIWGPSKNGIRLDEGFHNRKERKASGAPPRERLSKIECRITPEPFKQLLIGLAKSAIRPS